LCVEHITCTRGALIKQISDLANRLRVAIACALVLTASSAWGQPLRKIGELRLSILGVSAGLDPSNPVVPKNTPAGARVVVRGGAGPLATPDVLRFLGTDLSVRAELTGPSLASPISLTSAGTGDALLLPLPPLAAAGDYQLTNLRLVAGGRTVLDLTPARARVQVIEQVLITSVKTRPLTLDEIKSKGIVLDSDDYLGFEFTLGLMLESKPVKVTFPVIFDKAGTPLPELTGKLANLPPLDIELPNLPTIIPTMLILEGVSGGTPLVSLPGGQQVEVRIPSVLVIPGSVGYLKQFFSAQLFVANGAPAGSGLTVRDITSALKLPAGADLEPGTADDPLSLPDTITGIQPATMPVKTVGPDGKAGTADDSVTLQPADQAQAEFLIRGEQEGFHRLEFDINATLDGLATGSIAVTGKARGAVLVRNPYYDVTFTVPTVVRRGEEFRVFATVTNIGQGIANDLSLSLDRSRMSGAQLTSDETVSTATLRPGDAHTFDYTFRSDKTGQVVASYLKFDTANGTTGDLKFTLGVGERGVLLSPDTLVLPSPVESLPGGLVEAAVRVLGQAWSVANSPPGTLPPGVIRITRAHAMDKALALAEAGLRVSLGEPQADAVRDLLLDFYGAGAATGAIDVGFDQLLRDTEAGRALAAAFGGALAPAVAGVGAPEYERGLASLAASGPDTFSVSASGATTTLSIADARGRRLSTTIDDGAASPPAEIPGGVIVKTGADLLSLVGSPGSSPYTLDLSAVETTTTALSLTFPRGDGTFVRGTAAVELGGAARARVVVDLLRPDSVVVERDGDGDGGYETATPMAMAALPAAGPRLLSATIIGPETLPAAGPFGQHVALLFDRVVDGTSAGDRTHYRIPSNAFRAVRRQLSGRLVFGQLDQPEGPHVPTRVTTDPLPDMRGTLGVPGDVPLGSRLEDPGAVVTGRIFQADGQPVSTAIVRYIQNLDLSCQQPGYSLALAVLPVAADGSFEFRYVRQDACGLAFRIFTQDPATDAIRTADAKVRADGERIVLDIALFGRGSVTGVVRDLQGLPVGGAAVIVQSQIDPQIQGGAITDGDGRYTIDGITVGVVSVQAKKLLATGTIASSAAAGRIARAGTAAVVDLTLDAGSGTVAGTVFTRTAGVNSPAAGALVRFFLNGQGIVAAQFTKPDGTFRFDAMPPGQYTVTGTLNTAARESAGVSGLLASGETITGRDLVVETSAATSVTGRVLLPNGSAAAEALVVFGDRGTYTSAAGTYMMPDVPIMPDRPQAFVATSRDGLRKGQTMRIIASPADAANVDITLSALGSVELLVADPAGVPLADQEVVVLASGSASRGACSLGCGCALVTGRTNAGGVVRFDDLPVGRVTARATRIVAGFIDVVETAVSVTADGLTGAGVLRFSGAGTIFGHVIGPDGRAAFGADITIRSRTYFRESCTLQSDVSHRLRTDQAGNYRVTTVGVGAVTIQASHPFSSAAQVGASVTLTAAGQERQVDLTIPSTTAGELSGYVFLPDGVTPAGAGVEVTANGPLPDVTVFTDEAGHFRFARIFPAGNYTVTARDPRTGGQVRDRVALKATQDLRHDLRLKGTGTVRVRVVTVLDVPVTSAFVRLVETEFPGRTYEGVADASNAGVIEFSGVFEGPLAASASDPQGRGGRASATLSAGAVLDIKVALSVTGTVSGRLLDPAGTPVPFATVKLTAAGRVIGQVTTGGSGDSLGWFEFQYVPAGALRLDAVDPMTARTGFAVGSLSHEGEQVSLDVTEQALGRVEGLITGDGVARDAAQVEIVSGSYRVSTISDGNGRYGVDGVPEGTVVVTAKSDGGLFSGSATATLQGEAATLAIDVALRASAPLSGRVVAFDGSNPPPSAVTVKVNGVMATLSTVTDTTGAFAFDRVPAGTVTVSVDVIGSIDRGQMTVTIPAEPIVIPLNGVGRITGQAHDSFGQPVSGTALVTGTGPFPYNWSVTVPASGEFSLPQVLAGPFTASLRSQVGVSTLYGRASGTVVAGPAATPLDIVLQESGTLSGRVLRSDATTPALGTEIVIKPQVGPEFVTQAGTDGRFTVPGVPVGTVTVRFSDPFTTGLAKRSVTIAANGAEVDLQDVVLDDTAIAVVSVEPASGTAGVDVHTAVRIAFTDPVQSYYSVQVKKGTALVGAVLTLSADQMVLTVTPSAAAGWPDGSELTLSVPAAVTDVLGRNMVSPFTSTFRTVDLSPPLVAAMAPGPSAIGVPPQTAITVTFNEPLDATAGVQGIVTLTTGATVVDGTATFTAPSTIAFTPSAPLAGDTRYDVAVTGAVDLSGNRQTTAYTSSFSTPDTTAPVLVLQVPSTTWVRTARPYLQIALTDATTGVDGPAGTLEIDGQAVSVQRSTAYLTYTPPADLAQGSHAIAATARDLAGNVGTLLFTLRIDSSAPDPAAITNLVDAQIVRGTFTIAAAASDETSGVAKVEFYRDGIKIGEDTQAPYELAYNASGLADGPHEFKARATDVAGNTGAYGPPVSLVVDNVPLVLTITEPAAGKRVRESVLARVTPSEAVSRIDFTVGSSVVSRTAAPYEATLDVTGVPEGNVTIVVTGYPLVGETATRSVSIVADRTPPPSPDVSKIDAEPPAGGQSLVIGRIGAAEAGARVEITNTSHAAFAAIDAAANGSFTTSIGGLVDDMLSIVAVDDLENRSAPSFVLIRRTPTLPPAEGTTALRFEGLVADRVGPGAAALLPDGALDAVFTLTLSIGDGMTRQLSYIDLAGPSTRSTQVAIGSTLGVAADAGAPLLNNADGTVSFSITSGATLTLVAADFGFVQEGATYTATAVFSDGSRFVGSFEYVPAADRVQVAHSLVAAAVPPTVQVSPGVPGTATITLSDIRDIDGTRVPDGAKVAIAVADMSSKDARGSPVHSAGGDILDGQPAANNPSFRIFSVLGGTVVATYSTGGIAPVSVMGALAVVQVQGADASGNVLGTELVGALGINVRASADRAIVEPSATSVYADKADRRIPVVVRVRDANGNAVPDGTRVVVTATSGLNTDGVNTILSAGGTVYGGDSSPSGGFYRALTVIGGVAEFQYSAVDVAVPVGQTAAAVLQVMPATSAGAKSSSVAIGTAVVTLAGAADAEVYLSPASAPIVFPARPVQVIVRHIHDTWAGLVPDGARFLLTPESGLLTYRGATVSSAGGSILDGGSSTSGGFYKTFTVSGGEFVATYAADDVVSVQSGETKIAAIQVAAAGPSTVRLFGEAVVVASLPLVAPTHGAGSADPPSLLADGALHTAAVTFAPVLDAYGNPLPEGSQVVATVASGLATRDGVTIPSAGGQILNGGTSPSGGNYRLFTVQNGAVSVIYSDQNLTAIPGETKIANLVLLPATSTGAKLSSIAIGVVPITLAGLTTAEVAVSPSALHADGGDRRAAVTVTNLRDAAGQLVPDGTFVGVTATNNTAVTADGCCNIVSAGGSIVGGTTAGNFRIFPVVNGQVTVEYSSSPVSVATGEAAATVAVVPAKASSTISTRVIGTATVRLLAPAAGTVVASPIDVLADGADRAVQIVVRDIIDSGGVAVPDGARIGLTAANNVAVTADGCCVVTSAGGTITAAGTVAGDGASATNNGNFKLFTVANGEAHASYSTGSLTANVGETKVATVAVVPASYGTTTLTNRAFATGTVSLRGITSASSSGPQTVARGGAPVTITFTGIKDSAGNTVPDGTRVGVTAASNVTTDATTGQVISSVGGSIVDGTTSTDNGNFKVFPVINGTVTVSYQPPATAGTARIQIVPARQDTTIIQTHCLVGAVWTIVVQ